MFKFMFMAVAILFATTGNAKSGWDSVKDTLVVASDVTAIDIDVLTAFVYMESSFQGAVKSKTSTAVGLMQITTPTWNYLVRTYGPKHGITRNTAKSDPEANLILGAEYFKENRYLLSTYIGRQPTVLETYFAHKFGPERAARLIRTPSNVKLVDFYPGAASANQKVYYDNGRERTVGDFKKMFASRLDYAMYTYGDVAIAYKDKVDYAITKERMNEWIHELFYIDTLDIERLTKVSLQNYKDIYKFKPIATEDLGMDIYYAIYPSGRKYNDMLI